MSDRDWEHVPVLAEEVLQYLSPEGKERYRFIDGTLGNAGHSSLILKNNRLAELLGIDRDSRALAHSEKVLEFATGRIHLVRGDFSMLKEYATDSGWASVDAVLLDVGVSSPQLDDPERGFSFRLDGPLDMRMDKRSPETASRILNRYSYEDLEKIFREYGEVKRSRRLANAIVKRRKERPFTGTLEFAEFCETVLGRSKPGRLPTPTLVFQGLRIAVNSELDELKKALEDAVEILVPGGRLAVISFHSLEDRIVKKFFNLRATGCICPPGLPICICNHKPDLKVLTRKPVIAGKEELERNSRASSAKLRVAEKLG